MAYLQRHIWSTDSKEKIIFYLFFPFLNKCQHTSVSYFMKSCEILRLIVALTCSSALMLHLNQINRIREQNHYKVNY